MTSNAGGILSSSSKTACIPGSGSCSTGRKSSDRTMGSVPVSIEGSRCYLVGFVGSRCTSRGKIRSGCRLSSIPGRSRRMTS